MNEQDTDEIIPETLALAAAGSPTQPNILTRAKQLAFLVALGQAGTIAGAARLAGVDRTMHYDWMKESVYAAAFLVAVDEFADRIRDEVTRRAIDGWNEPVIFQGEYSYDAFGQTVAVRKFSDRLLELLAKAKCSEFKDRVEVSGRLTLEQLLGGAD